MPISDSMILASTSLWLILLIAILIASFDNFETNSISAGLDYPGVGPEHAYLADIKRAKYVKIYDDEALEAFYQTSKIEGIIPALETAHALAYLKKIKNLDKDKNIVVNMSGRGDKDLYSVMQNAK